jgi:putative DNA primase/helicase
MLKRTRAAKLNEKTSVQNRRRATISTAVDSTSGHFRAATQRLRRISATAADLGEHASYWVVVEDQHELVRWNPNRHKIADPLEAVVAVCHLPETVDQPSWLDGTDALAERIVACANALLDDDTRTLLPHTPRFFNQIAVPFHYDADVLEPTRSLAFLEELWGDDVASISALAEWFG